MSNKTDRDEIARLEALNSRVAERATQFRERAVLAEFTIRRALQFVRAARLQGGGANKISDQALMQAFHALERKL